MGLLASCVCGAVQAQTTPGQLLQDIRTLQPQRQELPVPNNDAGLKLSPNDAPAAGGLRFLVKRFVFEGGLLAPEAVLQRVLSGLLDRPISFDELRQGTNAIAAFFRDQGYLVRAVLPQQDITEGQVILRLVESRLGGLAIDNRSAQLSNAQIEAWFGASIAPGQIIKLQTLDQALLTLDDLPGVAVEGYLQQGEEPGQTVLALTVQDEPRFNGQAFLDNFGDKNTGNVRTSAQLNVNGLLNFTDQVNVYGLHTEGSNYLRAGWTTSAGLGQGRRAGIYASSMTYHIISAAFQSAAITGASEVLGFEITEPVVRSRTTNTLVSFNGAYNRFRGWRDQVLMPDRDANSTVLQVGASGNQLDDWQGGGINVASLMASVGQVNRLASSDANQVGGRFTKLRYGLSRTQNIAAGLSLHASLTGQMANKNMDSSEQLYLGGPLNVRAYTSGQGAASQGQLISFELRQQLPSQVQLAVFYDEGHAQTWVNNPSSNNVDNTYTLRGAGVSVSWTGPGNANYKATWAQRVGQLSSSVSNALKQSGGLDRQRFWLNASFQF
jgi:hemolysin activation/secretion protein